MSVRHRFSGYSLSPTFMVTIYPIEPLPSKLIIPSKFSSSRNLTKNLEKKKNKTYYI